MTESDPTIGIPGTRSDPEFSAVRTPAWEDPFTCRVRLPGGLVGLNEFLTNDWWNDRSGELASLGASVERVDDGWRVSTNYGTETALPEHAIVVTPPFPTLVDSAWQASGAPDFQEWVNQEVLAQADTVAGSWRYDLTLDRDHGEAEGRELFVWPGDPDTLSVTELLAAPHLAELSDRPDYTSLPDSVLPLAHELWSQVERADAIYRLSLVHRAHDAIAILGRATDPTVASRLSGASGDALRAESKRMRARVIRSGWRLTGFADALLWPITMSNGGEVHADFVCDVALDLMQRAQAVALPPAPDLAEWGRRLVELEKLRGGRPGR